MKPFIVLLLFFVASFAQGHTLTCNIDIHKDGAIIETLNIEEKLIEEMAPNVLTLEKLYKSQSGRF